MYDLAAIATRAPADTDRSSLGGRRSMRQYQVLHRIKADCAEPQGVADRTLDLLEPEGLQ